MRIWQTVNSGTEPLQLLAFGCENNGLRAKWGPGKRKYYILHYVLEGQGYYNGKPVGKGEGFLICPGSDVEYRPDRSCPWQYFWMSFHGDAAPEICENHINANGDGVFSFDFSDALKQLVAELSLRDRQLGRMYALALFYRVLSCHEASQFRMKNAHVEAALNYIRLHIHRHLTVGELASACNVDDRYLYNLFIKHMGLSPKQYLDRVRVQNAKALLRESSCPVAEVAASVGFEDALAFSRFFRRHTGLSPSAFRKSAQ